MANYLLKEYENRAIEMVKWFGGTERMKSQINRVYEEAKGDYHDFNRYLIWGLIHVAMRCTNYKLYDEVRLKYHCKDDHFYTLFKNAFKAVYGCLPIDFIGRA